MRNRLTAILLAFFMGWIGVHKFYLGRGGAGIFYLLFCWTGIPAILAFIDFILLLVMNDNDFNLKYNAGAMLAAGGGGQHTVAQNVSVNFSGNPGGFGESKRDLASQLTDLNNLRVSGAITEDEFATQKQKLLQS